MESEGIDSKCDTPSKRVIFPFGMLMTLWKWLLRSSALSMSELHTFGPVFNVGTPILSVLLSLAYDQKHFGTLLFWHLFICIFFTCFHWLISPVYVLLFSPVLLVHFTPSLCAMFSCSYWFISPFHYLLCSPVFIGSFHPFIMCYVLLFLLVHYLLCSPVFIGSFHPFIIYYIHLFLLVHFICFCFLAVFICSLHHFIFC